MRCQQSRATGYDIGTQCTTASQRGVQARQCRVRVMDRGFERAPPAGRRARHRTPRRRSSCRRTPGWTAPQGPHTRGCRTRSSTCCGVDTVTGMSGNRTSHIMGPNKGVICYYLKLAGIAPKLERCRQREQGEAAGTRGTQEAAAAAAAAVVVPASVLKAAVQGATCAEAYLSWSSFFE